MTGSQSCLYCFFLLTLLLQDGDIILHKPLQCGFSPKAEVLQEWRALVWVLAENLLLKAPASFRAPVGCSRAAGWISTPPWSFMHFKGRICFTGVSSPATGTPPCFPSSGLNICRVVSPPLPHTLFQAHSEVPPV